MLEFSSDKNLLGPGKVWSACIWSRFDMEDPECSDGSQSGNLTMKSVLWSCKIEKYMALGIQIEGHIHQH